MAEFVKKITKNDTKWENMLKLDKLRPTIAPLGVKMMANFYSAWNPRIIHIIHTHYGEKIINAQ